MFNDKVNMGQDERFDLEERFISFGLMIMDIVDLLPKSAIGNHIGNQLIRSGTSPAYNYGEAQAAESRNDFIHKMRICNKELKETNIGLQFIIRKPLIKNCEILKKAEKECKELNLIISKSIITAKTNSTTNKSSKTK
jgi:four helix bundle protein